MRNIKNLQLGSKMIAGLLLTASLITLPGCSKKSDCNIPEYHLHRYEKEGVVRYLPREELNYKGYEWTNDILYVDEQEREKYEYESSKGLISIVENEDYLQRTQNNNTDYIEYRYAYTYLMPIPHVMRSGKTTITYFTYIPLTHYSWTSDENHSRLTGETRLCHHVYQAYKIEEDEKGKYQLVASPLVDNLLDIKEEYPYIKEDYTKVINVNTASELDYEDGETDDESHIVKEEDEEKYEEGKEYKKER